MSLIQEALKRQQEDADKDSVGAPPSGEEAGANETRDEMPPPLPRAVPEADRGKRAWPTLIGVVLMRMLLIGGAVWMLYYAYLQFAGGGSEPVPVEITTNSPEEGGPPAPPPAPEPEPEPEPEPPPKDPGSEAVEPGPEPEPITEPVAETTPTTETGVDPAPVPPEPSPDKPSPDKPPSEKPPSEKPKPEAPAPAPQPEVAWPALTVEGTVGTGANGAAMINGQVIQVGERVQGVAVQSVGRSGVVLEYKGQTRTVRAGGSTR